MGKDNNKEEAFDYDYDYNYDYDYKNEGKDKNEVPEEEDLDSNVKDSNGTPLRDGDSVMPIKDLKVKGASSLNLKRGTILKGIRLTGDDNAVECRIGKKTIVLKTEFLKKK